MSSGTSQQIGPYRVLRQIGRGGMGAVYLCQHDRLGYRRAIKVLNTDGSETAPARFEKEAQVQAELDHPHLLKVEHSDLDQDGRPYQVMPYVGDDDGPMDLDRFLKENGGKLDGDTTARIVGQILEGLAFAHGQGLIHRDLKPANILIEQSSEGPVAKIADFGLVRIVGEAAFRERIFESIRQSVSPGSIPTMQDPDRPGRQDADSEGPDMDGSLGALPTVDGEAGKGHRGLSEDSPAGTTTQALIGTWTYMSPEQKRPGAEVDHRADLYAVGLLACRMLLGELPEGVTRMPGQVDAKLSAWDAWISRALKAKPDQRFQNAEEALAALPGAKTGGGRSGKPFDLLVGFVVVALVCIVVWWASQQMGNLPESGQPAPRSSTRAPDDVEPLPADVVARRPLDTGQHSRVKDDLVDGDPGDSANVDDPAGQEPQQEVGDSAGLGKGITLALDVDVTMELVLIEVGEFMMGSPSSEENRKSDEDPRHLVRISRSFYMGKREVTQRQWDAMMPRNPSHFKGKDHHPVEQVSWDDCREFCDKLSRKTGKTARLPTEAEWEFACRAGTTGEYGGSGNLAEMSWYASSKTHPVGLKKANAWGLHDMHGNVWEWCEDTWHNDYSSAPRDGTAWTEGGGEARVLRGASWIDFAKDCRSARRWWLLPGTRSRLVGLRVVVSVSEPEVPQSPDVSETPEGTAASRDQGGGEITD